MCRGPSRWRTADGSCNNAQDVTLGMANTPLTRVLPVKYADGEFQQRMEVLDTAPAPALA